MPSPFPGMDPYLEGELWPTFHHELAVEVKHQLAPKLQPRYYPFTEKYFLLESDEELAISMASINPDIGISQGTRRRTPVPKAVHATGPVQVETVMARPVPHFRVEIRDVQKRKLVTVIEFLSPANKTGSGRRQYLEKRQMILASSTHLLEIDLLRKGERPPMREVLPEAAYFIFLSREQKRPVTDVWPIPLDQHLPIVPVPLLAGDRDVMLDLQKAVNSVYDLGAFAGIIDYHRAPEVRLSAKQGAWAEKRLKSAGLR